MSRKGLQDGLGILVPEFPGQTHGFFWREAKLLESRGIRVEFVSTRLPPDRVAARHQWASEARSRAVQLTPVGVAGAFRSAVEFGRSLSGVAPIARCTSSLECRSVSQRCRGVGLALMGLRLKQWSRDRGVGHIHVHSCADSAVVAAMCRQWGGPSYSLVLHSPISCFGTDQRMKWRGADFGIVVSRHVGDELESLYGEAMPQEVLTSPMGYDETVFNRQVPYQPFRGDGKLRLGACSRVSMGKGIDTLIEVVADLHQSGIDADLQVAGGCDAGPGSTMLRLQQLADQLGVASRIRFLGSCAASQVREMLDSVHLFVTATRQEAIGVAIMEAMAMGLPVVATQVGGIPELIENGRSGVLVPMDAPQAMAQAIRSIISTPNKAEELGRSALERVSRRFSSRCSADRLAEVLLRRHPSLMSRSSGTHSSA